jgi:hypothetical protein
LWEADGTDDDGTVKVNAAAEIKVRWEVGQRETLSPKGQLIVTDIIVVVAQDIEIGSILRLGKKKDLPDTLDSLKQVVTVGDIPTLRKGSSQQSRRVLGLIRYGNELPTLN